MKTARIMLVDDSRDMAAERRTRRDVVRVTATQRERARMAGREARDDQWN